MIILSYQEVLLDQVDLLNRFLPDLCLLFLRVLQVAPVVQWDPADLVNRRIRVLLANLVNPDHLNTIENEIK